MNKSIPWRKIITRIALALLTVVVALVLGVYYLFSSAARPTPPPPGVKASLPFGAIDINELDLGADSQLQESIQKTLLNPAGWYAAQKDGNSRIDILALSGGGSRGAFGAGVLCGWSAAGTRPDFKIVTGVSTGALQSTFAFLGSEYDSALKEVYTQYETVDLYSKRSRVAPLYSDATNDSIGLSKVIEHCITAEVLQAVAKKHQQGYRLFVGTTNLDTTEFIIWNMGKIAASDRPDALQHYRKVLLASASIPVFFPPVYFEVQANGQAYHEMHVDGSTYSNLVFRSFMLDIEDAMEKVGISLSDFDIRLYIIRNGRRDEESARVPVPGKALSIAESTIRTLFKVSSTSAMYRAYVLANRSNIDYHLAVIPTDYQFDFAVTDFDREGMLELFEFGYNETAPNGYKWLKHPPFIDLAEQFE
jgi:predicted acylesterase/phospholipase RssA